MSIKVYFLDLFPGIALEGLGKFEEAIMMYDQYLKINPNDPVAYFNKGMSSRFIFRNCAKWFGKI